MSDRRTAITELLRSIPEPDLEELASHVHRSHHAAHELIFTKRDEGTSVMFVAAGRVKIVSVSPEGGEVILNIIEPGQVFGEMALLDGKPRSADAVAAVDTDGDSSSRTTSRRSTRSCMRPRSTERALRCGKARRCDVPLQARRLRLLHWPHRRRRRLPWRCCAR